MEFVPLSSIVSRDIVDQGMNSIGQLEDLNFLVFFNQ